MTIVLAVLALLAWLPPSFAANAWSTIAAPLSEPPQAIGSYSAGCLVGATALPLQGRGFQVMRPSRNRYYGHPNLTAFVERLGQHVALRGMHLLIGDLSQPRGGPMREGHRSHQIGLDVDIWFSQVPKDRYLSQEETERLPMVSVVQASEGRLNPTRWSPDYRNVLKLAAEDPQVERIFVNPIIKRALCSGEWDRSWLHKIRPWWGHDAHFHVRLRCPTTNPLCRAQEPLDSDDGCDIYLDQWVREIQLAAKLPPQPKKPTPEPMLPEICKAVLNGGTQRAGLTKPSS
jgi:penicillin-insensitive murein endopeptidase